MSSSGNPLLDQYNRDGIVTPGLQRALDIFKQKLPTIQAPLSGGNPEAQPGGSAPAQPSPGLVPLGTPAAPRAALSTGRESVQTPNKGGPLQIGSKLPASPQANPIQTELTALTDPNSPRHKSGLEQIQNPWARNTLRVLDAIGSGFAPRLTEAIPGTSLHHRGLVAGLENQLNEQQKRGTEHAQQTAQEAEVPLREAQTGEANARADEANANAEKLRHPDPKQVANEVEAWLKDPANKDKPFEEFWKAKYSAEAAARPKEPKEGEMPLTNVDQMNKTLESRHQVLHPGESLPDQFKLPPNATQKDYDRIDKALEATERATGTKAQQDTLNEMRKQTQALAAGNREHKDETSVRQSSYKAYAPALDSAERFNVMAKNYEDATKNHDQQAMLSLLANHLGMTMGLQKGSRLTRDIIREAQNSRPWLEGMAAKFDKDGYLSGVTLTPQQMKQMLDLGKERFSEDIKKSTSEAKYLGATDEGPERTPSRSTINYYVHEAGGDVTKAKQLAAQDGWSIK